MTLDEAIKHEEEVAEENEKQAIWLWHKEDNPNYDDCLKCANCLKYAEEHRQLAKWLKELKAYRKMYLKEHKDDCLREESEDAE